MSDIYSSSQSTPSGIIYCVTCQVTGQQYIGQTKYTIEQRWHSHCQLAKKPKYYFHRAIAKHGCEYFTIEVLECVPWEQLDAREQYWIAKKRTQYPDGYNSTPGGNSNVTPLQDLRGQQFGRWFVLERAVPTTAKHSRTYWKCRCACGTEHIVQGLTLTSGRSVQCRRCRGSSPVDMTGKQIHGWTVVGPAEGRTGSYWLCRCQCGYEAVLNGVYLRSQKPQGCAACYNKRMIGVRLHDLSGQTIGHWTVIARDTTKKQTYWWCRCECGEVKSVSRGNLSGGRSSMCMRCAAKKRHKERGGF